MITIPAPDLTPQQGEELKVILTSIFIEVKDLRLISVMHDNMFEDLVSLLRESPVCEQLYDMLSIFGEEDIVTFLNPVIKKLAETNYTREDYVGIVTEEIEVLT